METSLTKARLFSALAIAAASMYWHRELLLVSLWLIVEEIRTNQRRKEPKTSSATQHEDEHVGFFFQVRVRPNWNTLIPMVLDRARALGYEISDKEEIFPKYWSVTFDGFRLANASRSDGFVFRKLECT